MKIEGYYIERFINICKNSGIVIWKLKRNGEIFLIFRCSVKDFKKVCNIAKKVKCKVKIENKSGLPFFVNKHKKRKIFIFLLCIICFFILLSSNFIWNVEVKDENEKENNNAKIEEIKKELEQEGLKSGVLKSKINTKDIINKIRLQRNDIAWMGIELKGTNAIVKIVSAEIKPEVIDENEYCNIVSDKAGVITKINSQTGTSNVKVGDTVNVGDILINGWMEGKYTGIRYVHAKGNIEARVWYTKNKKIMYKNIKRKETGNSENKYSLKVNNFKINFNKRVSKIKIYDTIEEEKRFKIFSDFYLPISLEKTTYKEIEEVEENYNTEQAKNIGAQELEEELKKEIGEKSIINKNINTYEKEDGIDIYVTYEVLENIGTNEKIVF